MKVIIQENYEKMSEWAAEHIIKAINAAAKKKEEAPAPAPEPPAPSKEEVLLTEIRDLLAKK